jgi:hypothetical protein
LPRGGGVEGVPRNIMDHPFQKSSETNMKYVL